MIPKGQVGPKQQVSPFSPKMDKRTPGPQIAQESQIGHNQQWTPLSNHGLWQPPAQVQKGFPSIQVKTFPSFIYPVPKHPGMVHIWYNIPLCTIFPQQSDGDGFRTQLQHFNSSPQIHHPF
ncbi:hypothetical protein O181_048304 [Austropuccinia psidii MF-1]|uniref:Uncharacterized protein n=1 Tax=Austropuccinia psidii MF-1 TaxID=1389203 RepID=A0A9Q3DSS1_9BASI|nr:hypothetical protein [Austropuccinia psidii MF-1]